MFVDVLQNSCSLKFCNIQRKTPVLSWKPQNLLKTLVKYCKMFRNSFFKEHLWISESHWYLLLWISSKELQDSGVQKLSRHIDMNVNKLISLKNTLNSWCLENVCFSAATARSSVSRSKSSWYSSRSKAVMKHVQK